MLVPLNFVTFLKFNWEHFGMGVFCPTNLTLPWQPLCDSHVILKFTIFALIAAMLTFSNQIRIFYINCSNSLSFRNNRSLKKGI